MKRWHVEVRPPGRFKPRIGLVGYIRTMGRSDFFGKGNPKAITEQDAITLAGNPTAEEKLRQAVKMLDWHFYDEEAETVGAWGTNG